MKRKKRPNKSIINREMNKVEAEIALISGDIDNAISNLLSITKVAQNIEELETIYNTIKELINDLKK